MCNYNPEWLHKMLVKGDCLAMNKYLTYEEFLNLKDDDVFTIIRSKKEALADKLLILGHHYQRDEIIQFADIVGDSYGLSRQAASTSKPFIVFCGVHFMAESADILTSDEQVVILPDLQAGCSMALMAHINDVRRVWQDIGSIIGNQKIIPITYVNSDAKLKAFVGQAGGTVCTSSNAKKILQWALQRCDKVFFLPDQHLGRNTAYFDMNIPLDEIVLWNRNEKHGGLSLHQIMKSRIILWDGYCSVHQNFLPEHISLARKHYHDIKVIVHSECSMEVVQKSDVHGSTSTIIKEIESSKPGSKFAVGTEQHLVFRLKKKYPDREIIFLAPYVCNCSTMYRIDPPHLAYVLDRLSRGEIINRIEVPREIKKDSRQALDLMLEISC